MLDSWRNPVYERMSWFNFKHAFLLSFCTFKILYWFPLLWDSLSWLLVVCFSYWFGFVTYRWLKRYRLAYQVASYKKSVLISGCDTGFGNMLARKLATDRGFHVFAGCHEPELPESLKLASVPNVDVFKMDVTNVDSMTTALDFVSRKLEDEGNDLWAVVCNAGIAEVSEFEWQPMEDFAKCFNVNVMGTIRTVKTFLPLLKASKGRVVITASVLGRISVPGLVSYSMSKAALINMAEGLKRELAVWDVDVCTVEPTLYRTNMLRYQEARDTFMNKKFAQLPEQVRIDYGEEYFRSFWDSMKNVIAKFANTNPEEAVSALSHAITTVWPEAHYRVASTKQLLFYNFLDYLPSEVVDAIIKSTVQHQVEPSAVIKS